jgi:phospho-N-acetylmuramoyl-pentapeptide-transferase
VTSTLILLCLPLAFVVAIVWAPTLIEALRRLKFGKQIRLEGPTSHFVKAGTPTMGGLLFIATPVVLGLILAPDRLAILPTAAGVLLFGAAGALDDYANMKNKQGVGFQVRHKFLWHGAMAIALAAWLSLTPDYHVQRLPGGSSVDLGIFFIPFVALAIFSSTAGVNIVDGLDGLAGGTAMFAFGSYLALGLGAGLVAPSIMSSLIMGAVLAFLWFNVHPARVFMGDAGALPLGAALAIVAVQTHWLLLLPVIGFVFVVDLLSVILQVGYFRLTHGRRLFTMSPIHHGLEVDGWPETRVVGRFWILGALAGAIGVAVAL